MCVASRARNSVVLICRIRSANLTRIGVSCISEKPDFVKPIRLQNFRGFTRDRRLLIKAISINLYVLSAIYL